MYYREIGTKSGYKISAKRRSLIVRCCLLFGLCQTRHALALCLRTTQIEGVQLLGGAGFALAEQGECGGGNTKYAAIVDNSFMWLFTIPMAYCSAFVWNFPPAVTFLLLKADQLLKCIPNAIYCNRFTWVRQLTR